MSTSHQRPQQPILIRRSRGDKPRLLPYNRRLRHLRGISFRNLTSVDIPQRARGQTIDDDAAPYTLSSPAKLLALNENHEVAHSRSSDNLRAQVSHTSPSKRNNGSQTNGHATTPARRPRRRNTAEWLGATPRQRHKKLEEAIARHKGDVFFSVHVDDVHEPLYISETVIDTMNCDFRSFNLTAYGVEITCRDQCTLRFWTRHDSESAWTHLLDFQLRLCSLTYVGRSLDEFYHHLPDNFVFIHLSDGIYAADEHVLSPDEDSTVSASFQTPTSPLANAEPTSSYDALMRLSTLDSCIQDALTTQAKLTQEIATLLADNEGRHYQSTEVNMAEDQHSGVERALATTREQVSCLKNDISRYRQNLETRRQNKKSGHETHTQTRTACSSRKQEMQTRTDERSSLLDTIHGQRRRLSMDLQSIYPIEPSTRPSTASPLSFTIRGLHLPNSNFSSPSLSASTVSAALGYAAHSTHLISRYLAIPLPYPITPHASTSSINDDISLLPPSQSRTFPLYIHARSDSLAGASGSAAFGRFEYAVFLLNKDIEALSSRLGVRVLDIRQTLPNLKYIFLVATAGRGELPRRVVGGVKGLLSAGWSSLSPEGSRRGSEESGAGSEAGRAAEEVRKKLISSREGTMRHTGKGKGKERG